MAKVIAAVMSLAAQEAAWRAEHGPGKPQQVQQQQVGYPRVIGYYPGTGIQGYVAGGYIVGADPAMPPGGMMPVHHAPAPAVHSAPWRAMVAPGNPPIGEHHVPIPFLPETFNGVWGGAAGAPAGAVIIFSARPQKPFKVTRLLASRTPVGATALGKAIGQTFVGTSLQQAELGFVDLETIGAGGSFDTWVSFHQSEPGVWIRVQATLTAFPTPPDSTTLVLSGLGHYLQ
jgi:hypothetical protein